MECAATGRVIGIRRRGEDERRTARVDPKSPHPMIVPRQLARAIAVILLGSMVVADLAAIMAIMTSCHAPLGGKRILAI